MNLGATTGKVPVNKFAVRRLDGDYSTVDHAHGICKDYHSPLIEYESSERLAKDRLRITSD